MVGLFNLICLSTIILFNYFTPTPKLPLPSRSRSSLTKSATSTSSASQDNNMRLLHYQLLCNEKLKSLQPLVDTVINYDIVNNYGNFEISQNTSPISFIKDNFIKFICDKLIEDSRGQLSLDVINYMDTHGHTQKVTAGVTRSASAIRRDVIKLTDGVAKLTSSASAIRHSIKSEIITGYNKVSDQVSGLLNAKTKIKTYTSFMKLADSLRISDVIQEKISPYLKGNNNILKTLSDPHESMQILKDLFPVNIIEDVINSMPLDKKSKSELLNALRGLIHY